jgi:predicted DNA binding CopG/RHH family protein
MAIYEGFMDKTKLIAIHISPELHSQIKSKTEETGTPYSEVVRRALEVWVATGEMPKLPKTTKRKDKPIK